MPNRAWLPRREDLVGFEADLRAALVERELLAVRYVGLDYSPPTADGRRFHSIDFGVELEFGGGATWSMAWEHAGINEGLLVAPGPVSVSPAENLASFDFTDAWRERFPAGVQAVDTVWTRHTWGPAFGGPRWEAQVGNEQTSDYCLTTLILGAERDVLVVTLGGGYETEFDRGQLDNLAVFLSLQDARDAGALLHGDAEAITPQ